MSWLIAIGILLLILWAVGEEGDMSDASDDELIDELNSRQ